MAPTTRDGSFTCLKPTYIGVKPLSELGAFLYPDTTPRHAKDAIWTVREELAAARAESVACLAILSLEER